MTAVFDWGALGVNEGGVPLHLPMGVTEQGQGPEDEAYRYVCWCGSECGLTTALRLAWEAGRRRAATPDEPSPTILPGSLVKRFGADESDDQGLVLDLPEPGMALCVFWFDSEPLPHLMTLPVTRLDVINSDPERALGFALRVIEAFLPPF